MGPELPINFNYDYTLPSVARGERGDLFLSWQQFEIGPCLMCTESRLVERLAGNAWQEVSHDAMHPGDMPSTGPQLVQEKSGRVLLADGELYDPYHPPPRKDLHLWRLDGSRQDLGLLADPATSLYGVTAERAPDGTALLAHFATNQSSTSIRITDAAGQPLAPPLDVTAEVASIQSHLSMKASADGSTVVAFCGQHAVWTARYLPAVRQWEAPSKVEERNATPASFQTNCNVALALGPGGAPAVAFNTDSASQANGGKRPIVVRVLSAGDWRTPTEGLGAVTGTPVLAYAPDGTLALGSDAGVSGWDGTGWKLILPAASIAPADSSMAPSTFTPEGDGLLSVWAGFPTRWPNPRGAFYAVLHLSKR